MRGRDGLDEVPDPGADGFHGLGYINKFNARRFGGADDGDAVGDALEKFLVGFLEGVADEGQDFLAGPQERMGC